ncbi:head-tail adaptor protein [Paracoccus jiaweipingae]|uniref:head-tail adaptor protein n=1 Tax=unclassified Paracoccus (in: a-proteobacteria) TaxID=2688777 RepID=UPI00378777B1
MSAPRLNVPLVLEQPQRQPDGMGGFRVRWAALGTVWAAMRARGGREVSGPVGRESAQHWEITLRAAMPGDPRRPAPGQRLRMAGRVFRVLAVAESGPAGRLLVCQATEEVQT